MKRGLIFFLFSALFSISILSSCAGIEIDKETPSVENSEASISLVQFDENREVDRFFENFFKGFFEISKFSRQTDLLLKKYPDSGKLNMLAALIAYLQTDDEKCLSRLMQAAADVNFPYISPVLDIIDSYNLSYSQRVKFVKLLELLLANEKTDNFVKQSARNLLNRYYLLDGKKERAREIADQNGFIKKWRLIGAFDNDEGKGFYEKFPPETEFDNLKSYEGKIIDAKWRQIDYGGYRNSIALDSFISPAKDVLAYLATTIESKRERELILNISTGDPVKVFLNGIEVVSEENISRFAYDNVKVKVKLSEGKNVLLIKTCQNSGSWLISARFCKLSGEIPQDLKIIEDFPTRIVRKNQFAELFPDHEKESGDDLLKGVELFEKGYPKYSQKWFEKSFKNSPGFLSAIFLAKNSNFLNEEGKYIDLLNNFIKTSDEIPLFLLMRGDFFVKKEQKERGEEDYQRGLALAPKSIKILKKLAALYRSKGWYEDARRFLAKALEIENDNPELIALTAQILNIMGYKNDAENYYDLVLRYAPGDIIALETLAQIAGERREYDKSIRLLKKILDLRPYRIGARFKLFKTYKALKEYEKAAQQLENIKEIDPENPRLHIELGDLAYERNNDEEALEFWKEALRLNPNESYLSERISAFKKEEKDISERFVPSEAEILDSIKRSLNFVPDDGARVLFVYDHAVCTINNDGSSKWSVTAVSRALNDDGRDELIYAPLPYSGKKRILKAYSYNSKLEKVEASSISTYEIRFRQLQKGDFTVVQYIHYMPPSLFLENDFVGEWFAQNPYKHVVRSELDLIYPKERKIVAETQGDRIKQSIDFIDDFAIHKFFAEDIEPLNGEIASPPLIDFLEKVTLSTASSWDKYVNWEKALLKDVFVSSDKTREKAAEITKGEESVLGKIDKIFTFIAQDIRYQQEYETTVAGVKPHASSQILERGYGDCKDKAVLFIQLAKELGIKVDYLLVRSRYSGKTQTAIPYQQFNHAIVYIPKQEGIESGFFMDPTVDLYEIGSLRNDDQGSVALKIDLKSGDWQFIEIPYQTSDFEFQKYERRYFFTPKNEFKVKTSNTMRGSESSYVRQTLRTKESAKQLFQYLANRLFNGGILEEYSHGEIEDITKPFNTTYSANVSNLVSETENKIVVSLPEKLVNPALVSLESRKLPLYLGVPSKKEYKIRLDLPQNAKIDSLPQNIKFKNGCVTVSRISKLVDEKTLLIDAVFENGCAEISLEDYPRFRAEILEVLKKQNEKIILTKTQ